MIIKDYKYTSPTDGIHYTIHVDGTELEMHHEKTEYGSVKYTDIEAFLDRIAILDFQEPDLIEDFVSFQNHLLLNDVEFIFKNAEVVDDGND